MKILPFSWMSRAADRRVGSIYLASYLLVLMSAGQAPILAGPTVPLATTPPTALDSPVVAAAPAAPPGLTDPAQGSPQDLSPLLAVADDPKLLHADAVLAGFEAGASATEVIVTLQPTAEAAELATQSALSANRPEALTPAEAPVFYDLQDPAIRTRLHATVTQAVDQAIAQLKLPGLTVTQRFSYQFGFAARVTASALAQLLANPAVLRVEPDGVLEPHLRQGIPLMAADTPSAIYDGSGMSIAICDTGIDTRHSRLGNGGSPIFNAKVIGGYDTGDNDADPRPNSTTGNAHGTACAGIAAGDLGDSGDYIGGVAPGAKLYAIKISYGTSGSATDSSMIAGWEWAITHKNDDPANPILIISTSFGGGSYSSACDTEVPAMTTAAANAVAAGITIFASSGNDGYCASMGWPACISHVNSVGAVYDANFGTYNPCVNASSCASKIATTGCATGYYVADNTVADKVTAYSNSASFLTLFAPSNQAYTTDIVGFGGYNSSGDFYSSFGGTSAACPYAAGAAAVLQSAAKAKTGGYLTPAQVKSYLMTQGDTLTDGKVTSVKKPRINLARAVSALGGDLSGKWLAGLTDPATSGSIYYTDDLSTFKNIPGRLAQIVTADLDGNGSADLAGLTSGGQIYYTLDRNTWSQIPGTLAHLVTGNFDGVGGSDLAGLTSGGQIYYTTNRSTWTRIPGTLSSLVAGNLDSDSAEELAGLTSTGQIYVTPNMSTWGNIPGTLAQLVVGDFDGVPSNGKELAGLTGAGQIYYYPWDGTGWHNIPGTLKQLVAGNFDNSGKSDLAGVTSAGGIYLTTNLSSWSKIPGNLDYLYAGNLDNAGIDDLAGLTLADTIYYTTNLSSWVNIPGRLFSLAVLRGN